MRRYDVVLWDLDGTIVDSAEGIYVSFEHTFTAMGRDVPDRATLRKFLGPPLIETFGELMGMNRADTLRAVQLYRENYHAVGAFKGMPYDGVVEVVERVRAAGIPTALATSKAETAARLVTDHFDLNRLFDVYASATDDDSRKTKEEVVEHALALFAERGIDTSRAVLIGDRIHDVDGAFLHGIDCVLVEWGYGNPDEFARATSSVATIADLCDLLEI
jgi:phosphoglycolate phosphatase